MCPRTEQQFEEIRIEKIELIKSSALKLFADIGYNSTSISKIASEAGISKGLMYNYFSSKEELLKEIMIGGLRNFTNLLIIKNTQSIDRQEILNFIDGNLNLLKKNADYYKLYFSLALQPKIVELLEKDMHEVFEQIFEKFMMYFNQKGDTNPYVKTRFILALFDGVGMHFVSDKDNFPLDEVRDMMVEMI